MSSSAFRRIALAPTRAARVVMVAAAALLVSVSIMDRSSSAFSASTTKQSATMTAGTMTLTASTTGILNFNDMVPGERTPVTCVDVTYSGTVPAAKLTPVKLRGTAVGDLLAYARFDVTMGPSCADMTGATPLLTQATLGDATAQAYFASGHPTPWTPSAAGDHRGFKLTGVLPLATGSEAQGRTAQVTFNWDLQSKPGTAS